MKTVFRSGFSLQVPCLNAFDPTEQGGRGSALDGMGSTSWGPSVTPCPRTEEAKGQGGALGLEERGPGLPSPTPGSSWGTYPRGPGKDGAWA